MVLEQAPERFAEGPEFPLFIGLRGGPGCERLTQPAKAM